MAGGIVWFIATVALLATLDGLLFLSGMGKATGPVVEVAANVLVAGVALGLFLWTRRGAAANALLETRVAERTRELKESEARLRSFIQVAQDAVVVIDAKGTIHEFNPAAEAMFGYKADEMVGGSVNKLMPDAFAAVHDKFLTERKPEGFRVMGRGREIIGRRSDGSEFPIEVNVGTHESGGTVFHVGLMRDITSRKEKEQRLTRLATTDSLTGLLNRRAFLDAGDKMMAERGHRPLTLLMLDADRFKQVNDTHGHAVGDEVLRTLSEIVATTARADDAVGRLGGEEFAVLLHNTGIEGGTNLAERLLKSFRAAHIALSEDVRIGFTVSIGISSTQTAHDLSTMLRQADAALYSAKNSGRDRLVAVTPDNLDRISPPG